MMGSNGRRFSNGAPRRTAGGGEPRLRVLVESFECSPARGHAPGAAWQVVSRLAQWHDLWVLVEETQYRQEIEAHLAAHPDLAERLRFVFLPRAPLARRAARPVVPVGSVLNYHRWLHRAYATARALHESVAFDLTHHLRGNSFREPGYLWRLPAPFIWGPVGGNSGVPWRMMGIMDARSRAQHVVKNLITRAQFRFSPRVRRAARRAARVFTQTSYDGARFLAVHGVEATVAHEQAADPGPVEPRRYDGRRPLAIAWAGRCIALKGLPLLLRAMSHPALRQRALLHVAGDGPERPRWQAEARRLGIAGQCVWHGWLDAPQVRAMMRHADVLAFPSLSEGTPAAVAEALSAGMPVVCLKHCGFGDLVGETCGIPIEVRSIESAVDGFAHAFLALIDQPERVRALSDGASARARHHSWDRLAHLIREAYETAARGAARSAALPTVPAPGVT